MINLRVLEQAALIDRVISRHGPVLRQLQAISRATGQPVTLVGTRLIADPDRAIRHINLITADLERRERLRPAPPARATGADHVECERHDPSR